MKKVVVNLKKINPLLLFFLHLPVILAFLSSCTSEPVKRRSRGGQILYSKNNPKQSPFVSPLKKRIVILPLFNEAPMGQEDLATMATEELRLELAKSNEYVIDFENASAFGTSQEIFTGGGLKLATNQRKAKSLGINLIVYGRITQARVRQKADEIGFVRKTMSYAEVEVEVRVFDINANKELMNQKADGSLSDGSYRFFMADPEDNLEYRRNMLRFGARLAVRKLAPAVHQLGAKIDWSGRVAKILGTKVYVNAGRKSGLNIGDILKVVTEGKEIYDPETGTLLGISKGDVKGTLEVIDYFGPDGAVTILHSGGSVTEGDYIQLY